MTGRDADPDPGSTAENRRLRVVDAIREADVGREALFASLDDLDAVDAVRVDGDRVAVVVSLPVPDEGIRSRLERRIVEVATSVEGVSGASVRWSPSAADDGERVDPIPEVKNVVAVSSGKGGVGKSTVAVNLAVALADAGAAVGLLDADVYGPNAPTMLGLDEYTPDATAEDAMVPRETHGVKVLSIDFLVGEDDPVIWRGPVVDEFVKQLFADAEWGDLDYLVVDLPPGTGDPQLSLVQHFPVTGAVVVTTPQTVAVDDARRNLTGFARYDVPVLGIVENMATFRCPDCGERHRVFGEGGGEEMVDQYEVPLLGQLPLDPAVGQYGVGDEDDEDRGVSLPLVGRLRMPRTRAERERANRIPPIATRDPQTDREADARRAFRTMATRVAARVDAAAVWRASDEAESQAGDGTESQADDASVRTRGDERQ